MKFEAIAPHLGISINASENGPIDELDLADLQRLCRDHGLVLFTGFNADIEAFEAFTDSLCHKWIPYDGGAHQRRILNPDTDATIYSVNFYFGNQQQVMFELPLHADMSYIQNHPKILFFYSIQHAATGGETTFCDGIQVYDGLTPGTRKLFDDKKIKHIRKYPKDGPTSWKARLNVQSLEDVRRFCGENAMTCTVDAAQTVTTEYVVTAVPRTKWQGRPAFCNSIMTFVAQERRGGDGGVRFEDNTPIPDDVIAEVDSVTRSLSYHLPLKKTEFVFCDNTRFIHGRRLCDDPQRDLAIRMGDDVTW